MQIIYKEFSGIQEYKEKIAENIETLRPTHCFCCSFKKYPYHNGTYERAVEHFGHYTRIFIYTFLCPKCKRTMSIFPSFLVPHKRYTIHHISVILFSIFYCGKSILEAKDKYDCSYCSVIYSWLKGWHFNSSAIISTLRTEFNNETMVIKGSLNRISASKYVSEQDVLAFNLCLNTVYSNIDYEDICLKSYPEKFSFISNSVACNVLKEIQLRFSKLKTKVLLF